MPNRRYSGVVMSLNEWGFELILLERRFMDGRNGYIVQKDGLFLSGALRNASR